MTEKKKRKEKESRKRQKKIYRVIGRVVNKESRRGIPDLTVETWDMDAICREPLGRAVTDTKGGFSIEFEQAKFTKIFHEKKPDLFFEIFKDKKQIATTIDTVLWNVDTSKNIVIEIDYPAGEIQEPNVVGHQATGRLLNQETEAPLAGYTVHTRQLQNGEEPKEFGYDITNSKGFFVIPYTTVQETGSKKKEEAETVTLNLTVTDPEGSKIAYLDTVVTVDKKEILEFRIHVPVPAPPPSPAITQLVNSVSLEIPEDLKNFLNNNNISTLADIRKKGGLKQCSDLPVAADDPAVKKLDAFANLNLLYDDFQLMNSFIDKGYTSTADIARANRTDVHGIAGIPIGDFKSVQSHVEAKAQYQFLNNVAIGLMTEKANGYEINQDDPLVQIPEQVVKTKCGCKDCESAVSPGAYLADLLDYAIKHVKNNDTLISLQFLSKKFLQPFDTLPVSCEDMNKKVRQVRICIEVLRSYLEAYPPDNSSLVKLEKEEKKYLLQAYTTLLHKIGTSYEEIRLARTAKEKKRQALADRLGIDLKNGDLDHLNELFLAVEDITEEKLEELFGLLNTKLHPPRDTAEPKLQEWRLAHLRTLWKEQDFPTDAYEEDREDSLPIIDPDIIGPDDLRNPVDGDSVYELWKTRRQQIDIILNTSKAQREEHGRDYMLRQLFGASPVNSLMFEGKLSADSFKRLWTLINKKEDEVQPEEWQDVYSILTQVKKVNMYQTWKTEENNADIYLDSRQFWISLKEPKPGQWPPLVPEHQLMIDPGLLKLEDLPDSTVGKKAREFWKSRKKTLEDKKEELREKLDKEGFYPLLKLGLELDNPDEDINQLVNNLNSTDPQLVEKTKKQINDHLFMTVEEFERLVVIKEKYDASASDPNKKPTAEELDDLLNILTTAYKGRYCDIVWFDEEREADMREEYWTALKTRLPRWRASIEARRNWQEALRRRCQPPLIDPDLVTFGHIASPYHSNPANSIGADRYYWLIPRWRGILDKIKRACESAASELEGLDTIIENNIGVPADDLLELEKGYKKGEDIQARLEQLTLTHAAFNFLLRIRNLLNNKQEALAQEWDDVYSILAQVQKRRKFAEWRREEKKEGLTLGPDFFKFPEKDTSVFPPPPPPELPAWRTTLEERRNWEDTLQSRIDQENAVIEALQNAISETEAMVLPSLRDALIMASNAGGTNLEDKAKWVTDKLLIDAKVSGCQETTRISQAIETIQGLLFSLRNNLLSDTYPNLGLDADDFDEEWKWIGSYSMWRAAMFVFIYPENILMPNLRQRQTPAFEELVKELRSNRRLTPEQAGLAAGRYAEYYRNICSLRIEATCQSYTRIHSKKGESRSEAGYRCLFYMFGRGTTTTNKVYWSVYDSQDETGYAQTFWKQLEITGLENVINIIGAVPYAVTEEERYIFLFVRIRDKLQQKLAFTRYNLEKQGWEGEKVDLDLPEDTNEFTAVTKQSMDEKEPPHLAIRLPNGAIYDRKLNREGTQWKEAKGSDQWKPLISKPRGKDFREICSMVERDPYYSPNKDFYIFVRNKQGKLGFRLFSKMGEGFWHWIEEGEFCGALSLPVISESFLVYHKNRLMKCVAIDYSDEPLIPYQIENLDKLNNWLKDVLGLDLKKVMAFDGPVLFFASTNLYNFLTMDLNAIYIKGPDRVNRLDKELQMFFKKSAIYGASFTEEQDDIVRKFLQLDEWQYGTLKDVLKEIVINGNPVTFYCQSGVEWSKPMPLLAGLDCIAPTAGKSGMKGLSGRQFAYQCSSASGQKGVFRCIFNKSGDSLKQDNPTRIAPLVNGPFDITAQVSQKDLQFRRKLIKDAVEDYLDKPSSNLVYLEEAYYYVPVHLALQLQSRCYYTAALDWFRTVYDYSMPEKDRKIYYGLQQEESSINVYERACDWLLDPLNPHAVAVTRGRGRIYTRFTLLSIICCLLDYADSEFTRDTAESVPRARMLYLTALDLLETTELKQHHDFCEDIIETIHIELDNQLDDPYFNPACNELIGGLRGINDQETLNDTIDKLRVVINSNDSPERKISRAQKIIADARRIIPPPTIPEIITGKPVNLPTLHSLLLMHPDITSAASKVSVVAGKDFLHSVAMVSGVRESKLVQGNIELPWLGRKITMDITKGSTMTSGSYHVSSSAKASTTGTIISQADLRWRSPLAPTHIAAVANIAIKVPMMAVSMVRKVLGTWIPELSFEFCIPSNPVLKALRMRGELNLYKLRNCRNIAGIERPLDPYSAPTDTESGMPLIGGGGQLTLPGTIVYQPTIYRFAVIIERARQLVAQAQQIEAALLSALEKRDAEYYNLLKARQDVRMTQAAVRLQSLRLIEAKDGLRLAELQEVRAQFQVDHYKELLSEGISKLENENLKLLEKVVELHEEAKDKSNLAACLPASISVGYPPSVSISYSPQGLVSAIASKRSSEAASKSTEASILSIKAGYERRAQEWEFQQNLALHDVKIGTQQVKIANDHVRVVGQEHRISEMQAEHAEEVVDFLTNKFTNVELYDWMSNVLGQVYSYFLQQATSMAQLAAGQLAFERQETPPSFIQANYWEAPDENSISVFNEGEAPDRRGLTGSARLLQDIYKLDQYAFETDKRKLQFTRTFSLSSLAPAEFQRFRETGVMKFETPMEAFDRDFPGQYLRLIKRVRTSVIGLIPAVHGIKATLTNIGFSRVVIGGDVFQTVPIRRPPESVVLTAPRDALGIFELDSQSEKLFPFEGMGVDARWELRMPKAANPLEFNAIADVFITIEATALHSYDYQQQVIQTLDPSISAERPFSFRHQFPDQWYDLHNPDQTAAPMTIKFDTRRQDFPPNLEALKIQHLVLYFVRANGKTFEVPVSHLHFTEKGSAGPVGGNAETIDGIISTRKGNAGSWTILIGMQPEGEWELALPDNKQTRALFEKEEIEDILFVITYTGRTPEWPT